MLRVKPTRTFGPESSHPTTTTSSGICPSYHVFATDSACRASAPLLSADGSKLVASAYCADGKAYLFGVLCCLDRKRRCHGTSSHSDPKYHLPSGIMRTR